MVKRGQEDITVSYVILPARDHADSSCYRDSIRNHTTAAVAFL